MKKVIIVHGYGGYANKNWFPWLASQLERAGVTPIVPNMPNTDAPVLSEWLAHLRRVVGEVDENTYLVGHSLGCATILRFLEGIDGDKRVGGVLLVAGFAEPIHFSELDGFTAPAWDDEKIKRATNKIVLINSDNDPHVPLEMGERMRDRFSAELTVMPNADHISEKAGFTEVPIILQRLTKMLSTHSA